jgi:hypothetical protein
VVPTAPAHRGTPRGSRWLSAGPPEDPARQDAPLRPVVGGAQLGDAQAQ